MSKYVIEKGIPIPAPKRNAESHSRPNPAKCSPVYEMEVGDSFLAPVDVRGYVYTTAPHRVAAQARHRKVVCRITEDGKHVRIWRVE